MMNAQTDVRTMEPVDEPDETYRRYTEAFLRSVAGDELADLVAPLDSDWHWRAMNLALRLREPVA